MRRAKTSRGFAVKEVSPKSSFGVRTRAKTLALQRFQNLSPSPDDSFSFLQLRNRRLQKFLPSVIKPKKDYKEPVISSRKPNPKTSLTPGTSSAQRSIVIELGPCSGSLNYGSAIPQPRLVNNADEVEVSFGENILDVEEIKRNARETTPTSLIGNLEDIGTPASSTRPSNSTNINRRSSVHGNIPTTMEMEDFFRGVEQSQLKLFIEKYNYDPVNDCPVPGRYEWVKLGQQAPRGSFRRRTLSRDV